MNVTTEFEKDLCLNLTRETATSIYEGCYHSISDSILTELMKKFEGISIVLGEINYFSNIAYNEVTLYLKSDPQNR